VLCSHSSTGNVYIFVALMKIDVVILYCSVLIFSSTYISADKPICVELVRHSNRMRVFGCKHYVSYYIYGFNLELTGFRKSFDKRVMLKVKFYIPLCKKFNLISPLCGEF
jgi:hypothetical protein